jgi:hypothetical protein
MVSAMYVRAKLDFAEGPLQPWGERMLWVQELLLCFRIALLLMNCIGLLSVDLPP